MISTFTFTVLERFDTRVELTLAVYFELPMPFLLLEGKKRISVGYLLEVEMMKRKLNGRQRGNTYCAWQGNLPLMVGAKDGSACATRDLPRTVGLSLSLVVGSAGKGRSNHFQIRISSFVQDLLSWIQELKTLIQDFDLRLGDSRDDLRRLSGFN
ncbi:hypothetical protein M9H77_02922 [Catharanthus roseus]|uniref:Uncharacterized protein n=1 Tax=Catharanthus roseus TaxID=4058 RepID=A0ACC0C9Q9_CATRO|nr:hypothetical protein M9H77_02922 [Catharanthus roseus]